MRRRLLRTTLAAAGVALVLLGGPLVFAVRGLLTQQTLSELQQEAERAQALLNAETIDARTAAVVLNLLAAESGTRFILVQTVGGLGRVGIDTGEPPDLSDELASELVPDGDSVVRLAEDGVVAVSVPLRVGGISQRMVAVRDDAALRGEVRGAWLAIGGLGATALGAAVLVALWQGRRLAAPLEALAASARRLGEGDFTARAPRSGLPEADDVAAALDSTATRLAGMLERSRSFSADASHQLRTPLTALRLDLEALAMTGADRELLAAAEAEADRLEATITELLALAAAPAGEEVVDVARLVADRIGAWESLAAAAGRRVVVTADPAPAVRVRAAALGQSLQVLLDNALEHGQGTITVSVQRLRAGGDGAGRDEEWVRLCVADEGPGIPPELEGEVLAGSAGRGLSLATSLVEAEGGRLVLERARPGAVFCVVLPAVRGAVPAAPP
ncbi:MAG TPA: HAMP domain-containing sensor histidine kinase [Egibacteraceae bacterium]